ncbi:hypothetical protein GCM10009625_13210 [Brachybacterium fresconis]
MEVEGQGGMGWREVGILGEVVGTTARAARRTGRIAARTVRSARAPAVRVDADPGEDGSPAPGHRSRADGGDHSGPATDRGWPAGAKPGPGHDEAPARGSRGFRVVVVTGA